jgi:hypothetical protein
LDFYYAVGDNTESLYLLLSPYDWANHFLFGTIN